MKTELFIDSGESIDGGDSYYLHERINEWIKQHPEFKIIDIKFSSAMSYNVSDDDEQLTLTALVLYQEKVGKIN